MFEIPKAPADARRLSQLENILFWQDGLPSTDQLRDWLSERREDRDLVAGLAFHSPFLRRLIRFHPDWLLRSLSEDPVETLNILVAAIFEVPLLYPDHPDAMKAMRDLRNRLALHVACLDCGGFWSLDEVTSALTRAADAAVQTAVELALAKQIGLNRIRDVGTQPRGPWSGITIVAMGKHGASELNYSSDIDLIALFDPSLVPTTQNQDPLAVTIRVVQDIVTLLDQKTADGFVFRVDLRLRPDPGSTPLAISVASAYRYYETVGQNWERAALIKARPIAGDLALGESILSDLKPFIWRKYFDYAAIADIHAMKRQIYAHKGHEVISVEGHDIKLGRGGIREIEFFVQTQQLIYGGRKPHLRGRRTLEMLDQLGIDGWVDIAAVEELSAAYVFLRTVEHRLQMIDDEQTQRLPTDASEIDRFAQFCGFTPDGFRTALVMHLRHVETQYSRLFEDADNLSADTGNLVFTGSSDDPATLQTLEAMGFREPPVIAETIRGWHFGRRQAIQTPRAREALTEFVPVMLAAFAKSNDPDAALLAFDDALARMPAAVELFSILRRNAAILDLFAGMLGNAPRLAEIIGKRPHVLDILLDPDFVRLPDGPGIEARIVSVLEKAVDFESFLVQARELAHAERFLVGARVMSRVIDPIDAGFAHTIVAEAFLRQSLVRVSEQLRERYGAIPDGRVAILGFGKLGGREMTAASDLDLVILYDAPPNAMSDGERSLSSPDYYSRLTQRLVTALSAQTARGSLYEIDLRLRPSGRKGPVATSFAGFKNYQNADAETWEHMALTRARPIAGAASLCAEIDAFLFEFKCRKRPIKKLAQDIAAMRRLVASEKGDSNVWDLKLAKGGLLDIEFAAQFLILANAHDHSDIVGTNTGDVLKAATLNGSIDSETGSVLIEGWKLYTALTQLLRISQKDVFDPGACV